MSDEAQRYRKIKELFQQAQELSPAQRDSFLQAADVDESVRAEVRSMIRNQVTADGFMEKPAGKVVMPDVGATADPGATTVGPAARETGTSQDLPGDIAGYEVLGRLGEGAMGVVYRARQKTPSRLVALKLMQPGHFSERAMKRFDYESEVLGRLNHEYIARIYQAGVVSSTLGKQPFFAMELVDGVTLARHVRAAQLSQRQCVELMLMVCDGVQHAHQMAVVHRDLKPANILVTSEGKPKLLDFGIAKSLDATQSGVTLSGEIAGTPAYMSPEQARGDIDRIGTASDVWSLGVMLFELLTGRLPHLQTTQFDLLKAIVEKDAPQSRSINKKIDIDLDAITMKALSRDAGDRYASAGELASDLRRWLREDPVQARPQTTIYLLRKRIKQNRWPVAVASAAVIATFAFAVYHFVAVGEERDRAVAAKLEEIKQREIADRQRDEIRESLASQLRLISGMFFQFRKIAGTNLSPAGQQEVVNLTQTALDSISGKQLNELGMTREAGVDLDRIRMVGQVVLSELQVSSGKLDEAEKTLRGALEWAQTRMSADAGDTLARSDRMQLRYRLMQVLRRGGGVEESEKIAAELRAELGAMTDLSPELKQLKQSLEKSPATTRPN
jgi:serine/threonine protein kinase